MNKHLQELTDIITAALGCLAICLLCLGIPLAVVLGALKLFGVL